MLAIVLDVVAGVGASRMNGTIRAMIGAAGDDVCPEPNPASGTCHLITLSVNQMNDSDVTNFIDQTALK